MSNSERQYGVIEDILLPLDSATRYDVYFTDKRVAIVCMGHSKRFESEVLERRSYLFGVAPEALINAEEQLRNKQAIEEQITELPLDEKLKLSKKSCFYTYDEIEEVKLVSGKKPKFVILSQECISKFSPNQEQFRQLKDLLPTIQMLNHKLSIIGELKLNTQGMGSSVIHCKYCNYENDSDALFCQSCGVKIQKEIPISLNEVDCSSCGAKNKVQAFFCKKCGTRII